MRTRSVRAGVALVMVPCDASTTPVRPGIGAARRSHRSHRPRSSPRRRAWRARRAGRQAAPAEQFITAPGPLGPITVLGDSVLLGLAAVLAHAGRATPSTRLGAGADPRRRGLQHGRLQHQLRRGRCRTGSPRGAQQGWDPVDLVINLGANDSGLCGANVTCAYDAIMHLVNTIGPGHQHLVAEDHALLHVHRSAERVEPGARPGRRRTRRLLDVGLADRDGSPAATRRLTAPTCRPTATASGRR